MIQTSRTVITRAPTATIDAPLEMHQPEPAFSRSKIGIQLIEGVHSASLSTDKYRLAKTIPLCELSAPIAKHNAINSKAGAGFRLRRIHCRGLVRSPRIPPRVAEFRAGWGTGPIHAGRMDRHQFLTSIGAMNFVEAFAGSPGRTVRSRPLSETWTFSVGVDHVHRRALAPSRFADR